MQLDANWHTYKRVISSRRLVLVTDIDSNGFLLLKLVVMDLRQGYLGDALYLLEVNHNQR